MQSLDDYRRENPWTICNVQNSIAQCGRFPSKYAALENAECYGGAIQVSEEQRVVYVSAMPLL